MFPNQGVQQWSPQQNNAQYAQRQNQQPNAQVSSEFHYDMHVTPPSIDRVPRPFILPGSASPTQFHFTFLPPTLASTWLVTTSKLSPLPTILNSVTNIHLQIHRASSSSPSSIAAN
jgi:hypothetical protein